MEVTDAARDRLRGACIGAVRAVNEHRPGTLSDPADVVPSRDLDAFADDPVVRAYRDLSWRLGVDPTKHRPAGEALARRVAKGKKLPSIHPVVDAQNVASATTLVPLSAFDLSAMKGMLVLDVAKGGEPFVALRKEPEALDAGRIVWRDDEGVVSLFLYRDSERTAVHASTSQVAIVATWPPGIGPSIRTATWDALSARLDEVGWTVRDEPTEIEL